MRKWTLVVLLGLAAFVPLRGFAQDREAAQRAFQEGEEHYGAQRWLLAAEAFRRAHASMEGAPTQPLILFNIARSLEHAPGQECEAKSTYERFLRESEGRSDAADLLTQGRDFLRELDARISASGGCAHESISPIGPILLGAGGAALIAAAITGGFVLAEDSELRDLCGPDMVCPTSAQAQADTVQSLTIATDVLWIAGAAIAAIGIVLTILLREPATEAPLSAWCTDHGCGVAVRGAL